VSSGRFEQFDWREIADLLGAHLGDCSKSEACMYLPPRCVDGVWKGSRNLIVSDNGGEVNVSEILPALPDSIPLPAAYAEPSMAMAHRLICALDGHKTDYDFGRT
jgi:hypothetical protein